MNEETMQEEPVDPGSPSEYEDRLTEIESKLESLGRLTIQAIMELEEAIESKSETKTAELRSELSLVRKQLNDIIDE